MNQDQFDEIIDNSDDSQTSDEPQIISLEAYRLAHPRPDDKPPEPTDGVDTTNQIDAFWAGRTLAMRSARWAA